jgi:NADH:ubiquinone oxidoreductase subunit 2 (subunit N)
LKLANSNGGESRLETAISYLLVGGVVTSLFLEIIGMASFYYSHGHLHIMEKRLCSFVERIFSVSYTGCWKEMVDKKAPFS